MTYNPPPVPPVNPTPQGWQSPLPPPPPATSLERPGTVTGAAIIGFVEGGLGIIGGLIALLGGAVVSAVGGGGFIMILGLVTLVLAGVYIWGGVVAMNGKDARILLIAAGVGVLIQILSMTQGMGGTAFLGLLLGGTIIGLLLAPVSRSWFVAKGGQTF